jgi:hypothetical protein
MTGCIRDQGKHSPFAIMLPDEVSTSDAGVAPEGFLSASGDEWSMLGELKSVAVDAESLFGTSSVDGMSEEIVSRGSQNWCGGRHLLCGVP